MALTNSNAVNLQSTATANFKSEEYDPMIHGFETGDYSRLWVTSIVERYDYYLVTAICDKMKERNINSDKLLGMAEVDVREMFPEQHLQPLVLKWQKKEFQYYLPDLMSRSIKNKNLARINSIISNLSEAARKKLLAKKLQKTSDGPYDPMRIRPKENLTFLHEAARRGSLEIVIALVDFGSDVKAKTAGHGSGSLPIHLAAAEGHLDVVRYFVDTFPALIDAKTLYFNETPLIFACRKGSVEVARFLLWKKANIETRGYSGETPLLYAARWGHADIVTLLASRRANLYAVNDQSSNAVHIAAELDRDDVIKELVEIQPDLLEAKIEGSPSTPLIVAARQGSLKAAKMLWLLGANLEARDHQGKTPLMLSIMDFIGNKHDFAPFLIEKGANLSACDPKGDTLLHQAIRNLVSLRKWPVEVIVRAKPDLRFARNAEGYTPLDLFRQLQNLIGAYRSDGIEQLLTA